MLVRTPLALANPIPTTEKEKGEGEGRTGAERRPRRAPGGGWGAVSAGPSRLPDSQLVVPVSDREPLDDLLCPSRPSTECGVAALAKRERSDFKLVPVSNVAIPSEIKFIEVPKANEN